MPDIRVSLSSSTDYLQKLKVSTGQERVPLREAAEQSAQVSISDAAKRAAAMDAGKPGTPLVAVQDLHELIAQYDFHVITPRQLSFLAEELYSRGELTAREAANLVGTEADTEPPRDPNAPIDMQAHFDRMLSIWAEEGKRDSTLDWAARNRELASSTLADLMSFATSDRARIRPW